MHLHGDSPDISNRGYAVIDGAVNAMPYEPFDALLSVAGGASRRISTEDDLVAMLLRLPNVRNLVSTLLGPAFRPVRAIAFDKTAGRNWAVPWHQDRTIAVDRRHDGADVRCWTVKNGVDHCEPPVGLLERILTLRWHLDSVGPADGCIRVLPGSHRLGRLEAPRIRRLLGEVPPVDVPVLAGNVFLMSPLLVHSSRKRVTDGSRRVLHVELAAGNPPAPLRWYEDEWTSGSKVIAGAGATG